MAIKLFFHPDKADPDWEDCGKVEAVTRTVPKSSSVATVALQELLKGPTPDEAKSYSGFGPPSTNGILKSVKVKNGAAFVNFTRAVYEQMGNATSSCGAGFFASVGATLRQFPTIQKVYYAIEGNANDFYEWVQIGQCPYGKKICAATNF
jgi:spore germination protein GerM